MSKEPKPVPENDAKFPGMFSLARNRALKKAAIWTLASSATLFGLVCLVGGIVGNNRGFTTRIDRGSSLKDIVLKSTKNHAAGSVDEDGVYFLAAEGLTNARPTTAEKVFGFCKDLYKLEDLSGTNVLYDDAGSQLALAYTFYLGNASETEDQNFTFYISLGAYSAPTNVKANNPYAYLRVLVYANVEGQGTHAHTIYAAPSDRGIGTVDGGENDLRECLSEYTDVTVDGTTLRRPTYFDEDVGYCTNFSPNTAEIIRQDSKIEKKSILRYTIVTYFEGNDYECRGDFPEGAGLSLSAHFGD